MKLDLPHISAKLDALDSEPSEAPPVILPGDWIVCADDHKNWRFVREPRPGAMGAADVVDPDGSHPEPGTPVAACRECGGSLIVNGNQGLRFRVIRAAKGGE